MPVAASDIAAALRALRRNGGEIIEPTDEDHVRVWWVNEHNYSLSTASLSLDQLAAFERGETPLDLPEAEVFSTAQQREALEADCGRIVARMDQMRAAWPDIDNPPQEE